MPAPLSERDGAGSSKKSRKVEPLAKLKPLTVTWLGDSTNVLHDMLVTYPRLGHKIRVATPGQKEYQCPAPVWDRVKELGCEADIHWTSDPREAVHGANVVVTDTWCVRYSCVRAWPSHLGDLRISMGQEAEKAQRMKDFAGYQVTEALCREGGADPNWKFMHCLPRKPDEVDDEVRFFAGNTNWRGC